MSVKNLRTDHLTIRRLRSIAKKCSDLLYDGKSVPIDDMNELITLIEEFIDRCHHNKEECHLFPKIDNSLQEEVRALIIEHEFGRRVAKMLKGYLSSSNREPIARLLNAYVTFLDTHMEREERFFDMIGEYALDDEFHSIDRKMDGLKHRIDSLERKEWYRSN